MISFTELPPAMLKRARWAREQIIGVVKEHPNVQIDEDEMLAWVYSEEDEVWYSIAGNYSYSSPQKKMEKRRIYAEKEEKFTGEINEKYIERMAYIDYYSKVRKTILERDGWKCQLCDKDGDGRLHIHHILKRKEGGEDFFDQLISVCPKCHSAADRKLYDPDWT